MIGADLRAFLLADASIAALVDDRVYPNAMRQNDPDDPGPEIPAIVYQRIVTRRDYSLEGQRELARPRFQVSVWAETADQASDIADLIRLRVSGYIGTMGSSTSHGIYVVNELHDNEPETGRYRALLDLEVWHAETVPA